MLSAADARRAPQAPLHRLRRRVKVPSGRVNHIEAHVSDLPKPNDSALMSLRVPRNRLTGGVWDDEVVARISCRSTGHINPSICDKRNIDVDASPTEQVSRLSRDERPDVRSIHPDMPSVTLRDPKVRGLHMVRPRVGDAPVDTRLVAAAAATATTHRNASANHDRDEQAVRFHGCLLHTSCTPERRTPYDPGCAT